MESAPLAQINKDIRDLLREVRWVVCVGGCVSVCGWLC